MATKTSLRTASSSRRHKSVKHTMVNPSAVKSVGEAVVKQFITAISTCKTDGKINTQFLNVQRDKIASTYVGDLESTAAQEEACLARFMRAEQMCKETNTRLSGVYPMQIDPSRVGRVISEAAEKIREICGDVPPMEVLWRNCSFTDGATVGTPKKLAAPQRKWDPRTPTTGTASAIATMLSLSKGMGLVELVDSCVYFTVPKNRETDRACAKEPALNVFLQKGVGNILRTMVNRASLGNWRAPIDLNDQERNRLLAREAPALGLATIDLSMASDTIAVEAVRLLMPPCWFALLMDIRSPAIKLPDGTTHRLEKISSMGNGFTWELESLLFAAVVDAVVKLTAPGAAYGIFGDDLVLPIIAVPLLRKTLEFLGFLVNEEKSFVGGLASESCGKYYYNGVDVTPVKVYTHPTTLTQIYSLINHIGEWVERYHAYSRVDSDIWRSCLSVIPRRYRLYGDGPGRIYRDGFDHYPLRVVQRQTPRAYHTWLGAYMWALWDPFFPRETSSRPEGAEHEFIVATAFDT